MKYILLILLAAACGPIEKPHKPFVSHVNPPIVLREPYLIPWQSIDAPTQDKLYYIRDPRTELCFAYYWGGMANGGPAMTNVMCSSVRNLLIDMPPTETPQ